MPDMNETYRDAIAQHGGSLITHIGLVDGAGDEISGGSPAYARQSVTWTSPSNGTIRPSADLTFDVPDGVTVEGWRGYSASTGGTEYGGKELAPEQFNLQGTYTLLAAQTGILHQSP